MKTITLSISPSSSLNLSVQSRSSFYLATSTIANSLLVSFVYDKITLGGVTLPRLNWKQANNCLSVTVTVKLHQRTKSAFNFCLCAKQIKIKGFFLLKNSRTKSYFTLDNFNKSSSCKTCRNISRQSETGLQIQKKCIHCGK